MFTYQSIGKQIIQSKNLENMSYDKVKKTLIKQVKGKEIKLKDARRAARSIKVEEKQNSGKTKTN